MFSTPTASQQAQLVEIDRLTRMMLDELEETIQLVSSDRSRALEIVNTDFGQKTMADIRTLIDQFMLEEERLLQIYEQAYEARRKIVTALFSVQPRCSSRSDIPRP